MVEINDDFEFGDNDNGPLSWNGVTKKPAKYPPMDHRHHVNDIDGLSSTGEVSISSWNDITDKPSTFPPSSHTHSINDVTSLQAALDSKASDSHDHEYATTQQGTLADSAVQPGDLSTVATTGSYADLANVPTTFPSAPHNHTWTEVTDKPATYPPSAHVHTASDLSGVVKSVNGNLPDAAGNVSITTSGSGTVGWADITDKPATYPPTIGSTATTAKAGNYVPAWGEITGKPTTFAPATHSHTATDLSGVVKTVNGTSPDGTGNVVVNTTTAWADITGKPSTFAPIIGTTATTAKAGNYAPAWTEISGKPATFAPTIGTTSTTAKAGDYQPTWTQVTSKPATFPPEAHGHAISDVTNLQTTLDGKSPTSHTHSISGVTGLQTALDNKASVVIVVTGNETRPASNSVLWIGGTTQPVNALNNVDIWFKAS